MNTGMYTDYSLVPENLNTASAKSGGIAYNGLIRLPHLHILWYNKRKAFIIRFKCIYCNGASRLRHKTLINHTYPNPTED
jgi:hypothetical protein